MILKGNQRAGGAQMAKHLLNSAQNEHVRVHEVSGFIASDVLGALNEAYAQSKGTKCIQFMYALSMNPPLDQKVSVAVFEDSLERIEKKLGLEGQPRVVVFHEKEGRRHAHCVWSRIDTETMTAIPLPHTKLKLRDISTSLFLENGWKLPEGLRDKSKKNPLNYSRAEWQQALRIGSKPDAIKRELQECWAVSDSRESFSSALKETGYTLAQGRRGFVAVDVHGEVYSLTRQLGQKKKVLADRLGSYEDLPTVPEAKTTIKGRLKRLFKGFSDDLERHHQLEATPLEKAKKEMVQRHRQDRKILDKVQQDRWQAEELKRSVRIRSGFKGLWDKINGRYWKNRKKNEHEAWLAFERDQKEREEMINKQLAERQKLQEQITWLREKQEKERKELHRDLSNAQSIEEEKAKTRQKQEKSKRSAPKTQKMPKSDLEFDGLDIDIDTDHEPEI